MGEGGENSVTSRTRVRYSTGNSVLFSVSRHVDYLRLRSQVHGFCFPAACTHISVPIFAASVYIHSLLRVAAAENRREKGGLPSDSTREHCWIESGSTRQNTQCTTTHTTPKHPSSPHVPHPNTSSHLLVQVCARGRQEGIHVQSRGNNALLNLGAARSVRVHLRRAKAEGLILVRHTGSSFSRVGWDNVERTSWHCRCAES